MGGNIEGVAAASYIYFNKPPSDLNPAEAALLISLPKKPNYFRPDRYPDAAKKARNVVLARIYKDLKLSEEDLNKASSQEVPVFKFKNPYNLPHLVNRSIKANNFKGRYTIDPAVQTLCEYRLKRAVESLKKYGVFNGAMLVVDNSNMNVIAYVGSPDFMDKIHCGEMDGVIMQRSPGSTLKPVLYGLAIERGMITPKKILFDIPREYDGYEPVNASNAFNGPMTAEECLTHSLNSTAVYLEYQMKDTGLFSFLKNSGFVDAKRKNANPGLS
ncbi:MAG TPA: transglycosylase domain-containing protein, partial [Candidatus Goldiibacteriota bacterium]|nr:transglycosylase domain-containing protein [Candidatus Goldiibacteriota bacterium]